MPSLSYLDNSGRLLGGATYNYTMHKDFVAAGSSPDQDLKITHKDVKPVQAWSLRMARVVPRENELTPGRDPPAALPIAVLSEKVPGRKREEPGRAESERAAADNARATYRLFVTGFQAKAGTRPVVRACKTDRRAVELGFSEHMWVGDQYVISWMGRSFVLAVPDRFEEPPAGLWERQVFRETITKDGANIAYKQAPAIRLVELDAKGLPIPQRAGGAASSASSASSVPAYVQAKAMPPPAAPRPAAEPATQPPAAPAERKKEEEKETKPSSPSTPVPASSSSSSSARTSSRRGRDVSAPARRSDGGASASVSESGSDGEREREAETRRTSPSPLASRRS
jgi:hypothetical protein